MKTIIDHIRQSLSTKLSLGIVLLTTLVFVLSLGILFFQSRNNIRQEAQEHADRYYDLVRKMTTDVQRIAENTGFDEDLIHSIKSFVFLEKHDLGEGRYDYFDPSYFMAQSWQRMIDGKNILHHDLTLLRHEEMERSLMQQGYSQDEAHRLTSEIYNYSKEARDYYGETEKHKKD